MEKHGVNHGPNSVLQNTRTLAPPAGVRQNLRPLTGGRSAQALNDHRLPSSNPPGWGLAIEDRRSRPPLVLVLVVVVVIDLEMRRKTTDRLRA